MSFTVNMNDVYQQFANVWSSLQPMLIPFVAIAVAGFLFGVIVWVFKKFSSG